MLIAEAVARPTFGNPPAPSMVTVLLWILAAAAVAITVRAVTNRLRARRPRVPVEPALTSDTEEQRLPIARTASLVGLTGFLIVFAGAPGRFVNDNRFIMFWNPTKGLGQLLSIWDSQANLGTPSNLQGFLVFVFTSVVHGVTSSPWLTERALHGTMLAAGAVGVSLFTREFIPRSRVAPVVAGLWWIAAPYTAGFLLPSALYINAALCPWLALALLRALTSMSRWRWSAVFALCICISGFINPPALLLTTVPLIPLITYLLLTRQTDLPAIFGWVIRTGTFTVLLMAPWILRSMLSAGTLADNLGVSETANAVSLSSSWSESLRGMGGWLLYWNPKGKLHLSQMSVYMDSIVGVLLTFVPILVAYVVVVRSKRRSRLLFGAIILLCAMVMVGAYPWNSSSPFGRLLLTAYRYVPGAFALRNVYKAGGGLLLATCVLLGIAAESIRVRLKDRPRALLGVAGTMGLILLLSSSPLWTGSQYDQPLRNQGVPGYWTEAMAWLDAQPGAERALIAPAAITEVYNWGSAPSGDLFSSLMNRPYLLRTLLKTGAADTSNLVFALEDNISLGHYQHGAIGPIARRLGIGYVVLRNDLDWRTAGSSRPVGLDTLRTDPALTLVAEFGERGLNVVRENDVTEEAAAERALPPVQIYRLIGNNEPIRAVRKGPALLVSGDGEAWPSLAINGMLNRLGPIRYTGRLSAEELTNELRDGATLVITDTNRLKQARTTLGSQATLDEFTSNRVEDLFMVPGSQSVTVYPDAIDIEPTGKKQLVDPGPIHRPASAFDEDPSTYWLVNAGQQLGGEGLEITLKEPTVVGSVVVSTPTDPTLRQIESVRVDFSDGTEVSSIVTNNRAAISFVPRVVTGMRVTVTRVSGRSFAPFGISEISIPGVSLHESTRTADDAFRAAENDAELTALLSTAPISYSFTRLQGEPMSIERSMHRTFRVPDQRTFDAKASITFESDLSDRQMAQILGSSIVATAFQNPRRALDIAAPLSVDGNLDTAWEAAPLIRAGASLTFPERTVRTVDVTLDLATGRSLPGLIEISSSGREIGRASPGVTTDCPATGPCLRTVRIPVTTVTTSEISVSMSDFRTTVAAGVDPTVRVVEIEFNGAANPYLGGTLPNRCHTDFAALDGIPTGIAFTGTATDLISSTPISAVGCENITLGSGWHRFTSGTGAAFDTLLLSTTDGNSSIPAQELPVTVTERSNSMIGFDVFGSSGAAAITGQGYFPRWRGTANGEDLGVPIELDTQTAWYTSATGTTSFRAEFGPESLFSRTKTLFLLGMLAVIGVIAADPKSRRRIPRFRFASRGSAWYFVADGVACAFSIAIAGVPGLVMVGTALLLLHRRIIRPASIGWSSIVCLLAAVILSVPPLGPALLPLAPSWVGDRMFSHQIALISALLLAATMAHSISRDRPVETLGEPIEPLNVFDQPPSEGSTGT